MNNSPINNGAMDNNSMNGGSTIRATDRKSLMNKGWRVTFAGLGVNLALGALYSWGVFAAALRAQGWSATASQIPYMTACAVFALLMVPAGRIQDRSGPKRVLLLAAILTGAGLMLSGAFLTVLGLSFFYGVVFGAAIGFGYASTTPAAIKWFGAHRRGLISGIVVSGFGLAGIYIAPLTTFLIGRFDLRTAFVILGGGFCAAILVFRSMIHNPPAGSEPPRPVVHAGSPPVKTAGRDQGFRAMIRTPQFAGIWIMFFTGTFSGLMIIGKLSGIAQEQAGLNTTQATALVMIYAVFNWLGRIVFGILSDRAGRKAISITIFALQMLCYALFAFLVSFVPLAAVTAVVAFCFGGMLAIFPAMTADFFGVRNLGVNYGSVFTAWGFGGVLGPLLGGMVRDLSGEYRISYVVAAILCLLGLLLAIRLSPPRES
jgi:MFS transporter, OFA family, oxalate/formate antiporter